MIHPIFSWNSLSNVISSINYHVSLLFKRFYLSSLPWLVQMHVCTMYETLKKYGLYPFYIFMDRISEHAENRNVNNSIVHCDFIDTKFPQGGG